MRINCKQTIAKLLSLYKIFPVLLTTAVFFFMFSSVGFAPTKPSKKLMSDSELASIEGQKLFEITQFGSSYGTGSANVIHIDMGVDLEVFAHINAFKLGYYTNAATTSSEASFRQAGGNTGWDNDLTNFFWGSVDHTSTPIVLRGNYLELGFDSISSNSARKLNYIEVGSHSVTGEITATLNTVTGLFQNTGTGQNSGVLLRQTAAGTRTIHFSNETMSFVFATKYRYSNYSVSNLQGIFMKIPNYNSNVRS